METQAEIIELARRAKGGDKKAFEALCEAKTRSILYNAKTMLGNIEDAKDICSEVMLAMYKGIKKLRSPEAVDVWILQITRNLSNRFLLKRGRYVLSGEEEYLNIEDDDEDFIPDKYLLNSAFALKLANIVQALPPARREATILYYYDGLSYEEISQITGISIKTVSTNLMRARKTIRAELLKEYPEMSGESGERIGGGVDTNLGKAILAGSFAMVPAETIAAVPAITGSIAAASGKSAGLMHAIAAKLSVKAAVISVMSVSVVGAGVYGTIDAIERTVPENTRPVAVQQTEQPEQSLAPPQIPEEEYLAGEITFSGGLAAYPHVNIQSAGLSGLTQKYERVSWHIETGGKTVSQGEGENPSPALKELPVGVYLLKFDIYYPDGYIAHKQRTFEVM